MAAGSAAFLFTELLREHHMGVADMHRWAAIAGGNLVIKANQPSGTIIELMLPAQLSAHR
jgi:hypothetical protein